MKTRFPATILAVAAGVGLLIWSAPGSAADNTAKRDDVVTVNKAELRGMVEAEVKIQLDDMRKQVNRAIAQVDMATRLNFVNTLHQTLASQLELYRIQHNDQVPTLAQMRGFAVLLTTTDSTGHPARSDTPGMHFGPYLVANPVNPLNGGTTLVAPDQARATDGFTYDEQTGDLRLVTTLAQAKLLPAWACHVVGQ